MSDGPRIVMMRPPQEFFFGVWPRGPRLSIPTGLLAIASFLKAHGEHVTIYDAFVEGDNFEGGRLVDARRWRRRRMPRRLLANRLAQFDEAGSVTVGELRESPKDLVHFGANWSRIESDLVALSPDIVGITNIFRENTSEALKLARLARRLFPGVVVVLGGPNANAEPEKLLRENEAIDFIGLGDGEDVMLGIAKYWRGEIGVGDLRGVVRRSREGVIRSAPAAAAIDLDAYGELNYSLLRLERYFAYERSGIMARNKFVYAGSERAISMVTSRGCPYSCTFCSVHIHAGKKLRRHSASFVLDELEKLVKVYGVRHIHFEDDNLALDRRRFQQILTGILDRNLSITWDTPNGIFAENLDEETLRLMKESGCTYAIVGVESGDQWVLDNLVKKQPLKLGTVLEVFEAAKRVGLDLHAFYIIGFPRESLAQIKRTLSFAETSLRRYGVVPHLSIARADPGTEMYAVAAESGVLVRDYSISNAGGVRADMFKRHVISTSDFTPELLEALNERFHRSCMRWLLLSRAKFLLRRPLDLLHVAGRLGRDVALERLSPREALVKLYWCNLLYLNSILVHGYQSRIRSHFSLLPGRRRLPARTG